MPSSVLQQLISERIQRDGPITFAEYMRMALYEPGYGYYMTGASKIGWEGDYFTNTDVSSLFASCMGRQLYGMWEKLKRPTHFIVLEQGAGRGHLAEGVQAWSQKAAPEFRTALDYRTEDIRAGQDVLGMVRTIDAPSVILSNELIDAFPVHIVEKHGERLYEVYVDALPEGRLCEVLDEPSAPEVANYLDIYKIPWRTFDDGWRAEISLDALKALYTAFRRRGTLLCYFQHQANERPLVRPGEQDITAHVNFSALIDEGRRLGLRLHKFTTQRLWLESMGVQEELEKRRIHDFPEMDTTRATDLGQVALLKWYDLRQRVAVLTDPYGMGNFKVLILRR